MSLINLRKILVNVFYAFRNYKLTIYNLLFFSDPLKAVSKLRWREKFEVFFDTLSINFKYQLRCENHTSKL